MKTFFILFIFTLLATNVFCQEYPLTGSWTTEDHTVSYQFKSDSSVIFTQSGSSVFANKYEIDHSTKPAQLTFILERGNMKMEIPALIKFIDHQNIIIEQFTPYSRPTSFSDENDSFQRKNYHVLKKDE